MQITNAFKPCEYKAGETIIKQGDNGDDFYVVETGTMSVIVDEKTVSTLAPKGSFGELALLFNSPRAASVVCDTDATVFALDRQIFRHTLASMSHLNYEVVLKSLDKVPLLKDLAPWQKEKIAQSVQPVHFSEGDVIIQKGEAGNIFYIIAEGVVTCTDTGSGMSALDLTQGMYFGEIALMKDEPRAATVTAKSEVQLMALDRQGFNELLGPLKDALDHELGVRVLNSISFLSGLTSKERDRVIQSCTIEQFKEGTQILKQNERGDTFYIIKKGEAAVWVTDEEGKRAEVAKLSQGEYFGEVKASLFSVSILDIHHQKIYWRYSSPSIHPSGSSPIAADTQHYSSYTNNCLSLPINAQQTSFI
jgi:CRP-like cAMP-binding protein